MYCIPNWDQIGSATVHPVREARRAQHDQTPFSAHYCASSHIFTAMEPLFSENRDYFIKRIQDLESSSILSKKIGPSETVAETPDTAVCVRIRPLAEHEINQDHVKGVLTDNYSVVNIHEPRRKVNGKPDLNVLTRLLAFLQEKNDLEMLTGFVEFVF